MTELYPQVFLEAAHVASIIPLGHEPTFFAMKAFGSFSMTLPFVLALIGSTLGQLFNWYIGQILLKAKQTNNFNVNEYWYGKISRLFNQYVFFLLFFSWVPLCNILVVAAGFLNTRLIAVLPLVMLGEAMHYGLALF